MSAVAAREQAPPGAAPVDAAVEVRGVGKVYPGGVEALRDIDLVFPRGHLTTLLGRPPTLPPRPDGCCLRSGAVRVKSRPEAGPAGTRSALDAGRSGLTSIVARRGEGEAHRLELAGVGRARVPP